MHICISKLTIIGSDNGLVPGHLYIFIKKNAFENVVYEMSAILSQPQCVNIMFADVPEPCDARSFAATALTITLNMLFFSCLDVSDLHYGPTKQMTSLIKADEIIQRLRQHQVFTLPVSHTTCLLDDCWMKNLTIYLFIFSDFPREHEHVHSWVAWTRSTHHRASYSLHSI